MLHYQPLLLLLAGTGAAAQASSSSESPYADSDSYDTKDLTSSSGALDCGTAYVVEDETKKWENRVQISIRFPDWRDGTRVTADLGGGITSLETCWNVAASSEKLATGGNGEPVVTFELGAAPHDLAVGCSFLGFWNGGAKIVYDGSACMPPPPPAFPDHRYWVQCEKPDWAAVGEETANSAAHWTNAAIPPPPPPPPLDWRMPNYMYRLINSDAKRGVAIVSTDSTRACTTTHAIILELTLTLQRVATM